MLLLIAHPLLRRVYQLYKSQGAQNGPSNSSCASNGDAQLEQRMRFDFGFGLVFITALHGISALKVLLILYVNYRIGKDVPRPYVPAVTWIFNICILFTNELCGGYPFERIAMVLAPESGTPGEKTPLLLLWARMIDGIGGIMPRWEVLFKVTVLRLISFNMDYYWSVDYPASSPIEVRPPRPLLTGN